MISLHLLKRPPSRNITPNFLSSLRPEHPLNSLLVMPFKWCFLCMSRHDTKRKCCPRPAYQNHHPSSSVYRRRYPSCRTRRHDSQTSVRCNRCHSWIKICTSDHTRYVWCSICREYQPFPTNRPVIDHTFSCVSSSLSSSSFSSLSSSHSFSSLDSLIPGEQHYNRKKCWKEDYIACPRLYKMCTPSATISRNQVCRLRRSRISSCHRPAC